MWQNTYLLNQALFKIKMKTSIKLLKLVTKYKVKLDTVIKLRRGLIDLQYLHKVSTPKSFLILCVSSKTSRDAFCLLKYPGKVFVMALIFWKNF